MANSKNDRGRRRGGGGKRRSPKTRPGGRITRKEDARIRRFQTVVDEANACQDPLQLLPPSLRSVPVPSSSLASEESSASILEGATDAAATSASNTTTATAAVRHYASSSSSNLPPNILKQCLDLFRRNMGGMYEKSDWGLDMEKKEDELRHADAKFLVVVSSSPSESNDDAATRNGDGDDATTTGHDGTERRDAAPVVIAFAHFRYELLDVPAMPITYLYELQVHPKHRSLGLGRHLMTIIERLSAIMGMQKIMLTAFRSNRNAMRFYESRCGYSVDESSPSNFNDEEDAEECDYEILSKVVPKGGGSIIVVGGRVKIRYECGTYAGTIAEVRPTTSSQSDTTTKLDNVVKRIRVRWDCGDPDEEFDSNEDGISFI
mmetsp:Transcript_29946/g.72329  ORF Transcript_29946/g.72329 Transcript_29946/m.72329 type:complete len:377 (+) Transcript_29946:167-1297(+)